MDGTRRLPAAVALAVLGASVMLLGGFWFGAVLVACGLVGLLVAYRQGRGPAWPRPGREWTRRRAVLWALGVSGAHRWGC